MCSKINTIFRGLLDVTYFFSKSSLFLRTFSEIREKPVPISVTD